jgi:Protein of unknown function (DUF1501)
MKPMTRRNVLRGALLAGGGLALRSIATGLSTSFLATGTAVAEPTTTPTFLLLATASEGDPLNIGAPGSLVDSHLRSKYDAEHPAEVRSANVSLGGSSWAAAAPWAALPAALRARLAFVHHRTNAETHPEHQKVLRVFDTLRGATGNGVEMLPSAIAAELAAGLGTLQREPMVLGQERVTFEARLVEQLSPVELKSLLGGAPGPLANFGALRDRTLDAIYADLKARGTRAQKAYLDRAATSHAQAAALGDQLAADLQVIPVNDGTTIVPGLDADYPVEPIEQILAAISLFKYKVAPVVTIHLPFGGDNHKDTGYAAETLELQGGVSMIKLVWDKLSAAGLADQTTFATLNTFGRTFEGVDGRAHNSGHHVMAMFGPKVRGGVAGGPKRGTRDWVASEFSSTTGATTGADVPEDKTFAAAARTLMRATGVPADRVEVRLPGTTVSAVLT